MQGPEASAAVDFATRTVGTRSSSSSATSSRGRSPADRRRQDLRLLSTRTPTRRRIGPRRWPGCDFNEKRQPPKPYFLPLPLGDLGGRREDSLAGWLAKTPHFLESRVPVAQKPSPEKGVAHAASLSMEVILTRRGSHPAVAAPSPAWGEGRLTRRSPVDDTLRFRRFGERLDAVHRRMHQIP